MKQFGEHKVHEWSLIYAFAHVVSGDIWESARWYKVPKAYTRQLTVLWVMADHNLSPWPEPNIAVTTIKPSLLHSFPGVFLHIPLWYMVSSLPQYTVLDHHKFAWRILIKYLWNEASIASFNNQMFYSKYVAFLTLATSLWVWDESLSWGKSSVQCSGYSDQQSVQICPGKVRSRPEYAFLSC